MLDRREEIIERVRQLGAGIDGVLTSVRNVDILPAARRPATVVHDGTEQITTTDSRHAGASSMMRLEPVVEILHGKNAEGIGPAMSTLRRLMILAVTGDQYLIDLIGGRRGNGSIIYMGSELNTSPEGETQEAKLILNFAFVYPLILSELEA